MGNVSSANSNVYKAYEVAYPGATPQLLGTTLSRKDAKFVIKCYKPKFSHSKRKFKIVKANLIQ